MRYVLSEPAASYPADFDCPMRQLALEYAMEIQPNLSSDQLQEIADALNGAQESLNKSCVQIPTDWKKKHRTTPSWNDLHDFNNLIPSIYVDYDKGDDKNTGLSINSPLKYLDTAIYLIRKLYGNDIYKQIILRKGRHYLRKTVNITPNDNNLLITNYNNELVEISGAIPINCEWINISDQIYSCDLSKNNNITTIPGLRVNGKRAIRARYPNGNPEVYPCGFCSTLNAASWIPPSCTPQPDIEYNPIEPDRNNSIDNYYYHYQLGVGGCCDVFTPNAGYWCGNKTQGGGAFTYLIPSGLNYSGGILPNAPYANITDGVIQTWRPNHWSSWMFEVKPSNYNASSSIIMFKKGGFQGARGAATGAEFYIENVREELDYATEYFFNKTTKTLYYVHNGTGAPSNDTVFEVTNLKVLLNYTGTMKKPVENQIVRGITFRDTQYTYLDNHGMPSGGDWSLARAGALYLDGVRNITIKNNILTRLDGNGISVNRYARDVVIEENEIVWQGDNAVSMWGDTENITFSDGTSMGWSGTNGNQPRGTIVRANYVHEIGIWEKQSSMYFQAKSCSNIIENNIFFNGPRAGINFNDGFGGNSTVRKNLLFNTCRESGDHGPFNSWDRQVYVTSIANGTPSVVKAYDHIYKNFFIANYNAGFAVDNDDGSCYYDTHDNFFVYGRTGMKSNLGGHDNRHYNNIYAYLMGSKWYKNWNCFAITAQLQGRQDMYYNNTCIIQLDAPLEYAYFDCGTQNENNEWPKLGNNKIYQMNNTNTSNTGLCGLNEKSFQQKYPGVDDDTVIFGKPNDTQILQQATDLIF